MSENSAPEERTEMPSDRRMSELRKEGQVPLSTDIGVVISLITGFIMLRFMWGWFAAEIQYVLRESMAFIASGEVLTPARIQVGLADIILHVVPPVAVIALVVSFFASMAVMLQTKWCVKDKLIKFRFDQLNPITGVKKLFSISQLVQTLKSLLKLMVILPIGYFALKAYAPEMIMLIHLTVYDIAEYMQDAFMALFWKIMYVLIALAIFDYLWTRFQWLKQNKMTKDEVKDERKSIDGDETTRRKIQAKGLARIAQRIRQSVPQADVVVTNPTHFAVALKYDREQMDAPVVVAKGKGFLAQRIKQIARESNVPVLERKALARALYHSTEVGSQIPRDLFKAVAEVLAYVYRLRNPYAYARQ